MNIKDDFKEQSWKLLTSYFKDKLVISSICINRVRYLGNEPETFPFPYNIVIPVSYKPLKEKLDYAVLDFNSIKRIWYNHTCYDIDENFFSNQQIIDFTKKHQWYIFDENISESVESKFKSEQLNFDFVVIMKSGNQIDYAIDAEYKIAEDKTSISREKIIKLFCIAKWLRAREACLIYPSYIETIAESKLSAEFYAQVNDNEIKIILIKLNEFITPSLSTKLEMGEELLSWDKLLI